jgi:hypothetical protein
LAKKPTLTVVGAPPSTISPHRKLDPSGAGLWRAVMTDYEIVDAGGLEMLLLACEQLDRAEACRAAIDADSEVIRSKSGAREHPLIKAELSARAFVVRTLARLGLDVEPVRSVGRPPGAS